jgi:hypothetical protein
MKHKRKRGSSRDTIEAKERIFRPGKLVVAFVAALMLFGVSNKEVSAHHTSCYLTDSASAVTKITHGNADKPTTSSRHASG